METDFIDFYQHLCIFNSKLDFFLVNTAQKFDANFFSTPAQIQLLLSIEEHGQNISYIYDKKFYTGSNLSYNLNLAVQMGYIERTPAKYDKRMNIISLTDKGKEFKCFLLENINTYLNNNNNSNNTLKEDTKNLIKYIKSYKYYL